jgi:3-methyladenine DNA glycosylase AlkD
MLRLASNERAISSQRFFKTGKGEYGEHDIFHGIAVPQQRLLAKKFAPEADAKCIAMMLESKFHEERLTAVFMLEIKFKADLKKKNGKSWVDLYLEKKAHINNWDIVDSSAYQILGKWLQDKDRSILYELAASDSIWDNRIAIVATKYFIKHNDFKDLLKLAPFMLNHPHDLIHKATGWMLREAWQINAEPIEKFLDQYHSYMPRTMLRYTIEKMEEQQRLYYLKGKKVEKVSDLPAMPYGR